MKYIIIPVLRFMYLIIHYSIFLPSILLILFLYSFWDFKYKRCLELFDVPFSSPDELKVYHANDSEEFFIYETCFDWFMRRKVPYKKSSLK